MYPVFVAIKTSPKISNKTFVNFARNKVVNHVFTRSFLSHRKIAMVTNKEEKFVKSAKLSFILKMYDTLLN